MNLPIRIILGKANSYFPQKAVEYLSENTKHHSLCFTESKLNLESTTTQKARISLIKVIKQQLNLTKPNKSFESIDEESEIPGVFPVDIIAFPDSFNCWRRCFGDRTGFVAGCYFHRLAQGH